MLTPEQKERISPADILSSIDEGIITPLEVAYAVRHAAENLHRLAENLHYRAEVIAGNIPVFPHVTTYGRFIEKMSQYYSSEALNRAWSAVVRSESRWRLPDGVYGQIVIGSKHSGLFGQMVNLAVLIQYIDRPPFGLGPKGQQIFIDAYRYAEADAEALELAETRDPNVQ